MPDDTEKMDEMPEPGAPMDMLRKTAVKRAGKRMGQGPPEPEPEVGVEIEIEPMGEPPAEAGGMPEPVKRFVGEPVPPEKEGEVQWTTLDSAYTVKGPDGKDIVVREVGVVSGGGAEPENEEPESMTLDNLPDMRESAIKKAMTPEPAEGE